MIPQSYRVRPMFGPRRHPCCHSYWWTPERDKKLCYVMDAHDDLAKAMRVLGVPPGAGGWVVNRWNKLRRERGDFA